MWNIPKSSDHLCRLFADGLLTDVLLTLWKETTLQEGLYLPLRFRCILAIISGVNVLFITHPF